MPNNFDRKQEIFWNIFSIVVAVILIAGMLCLSVLGVKVSLEQLDRKCVAYADSTDGVVEDNLLINNDLYFDNKTGQGWIGDSQWWLGQSNSTGSITNHNVLTSSNTSGYVNIRQWLDGVRTDEDLTFRVQLSSYTGNWLVQIWNYQDKNGSPTQGYTTGWQSSNYLSATFQLDGQYSYFMFVIQCRNTITLDYAKLEYGTSFTGYVQKDYRNYGYVQGYNSGLDYAKNNFNITNGYSFIGSVDTQFGITSNIAKSMADPTLQFIYTNNPPNMPVQYYDFTIPSFTGNDTYQFVKPLFLSYLLSTGSTSDERLQGIYDASFPSKGSNVITSLYLGSLMYTGFPIYLFYNNSSSDLYGLVIVNSNDHSQVFYQPITYTTSINEYSACLINNLLEGNSFDIYLVPAYSVANTTYVKDNTALNLTCQAVCAGMGYYALYERVDSYTVGVESYNKGYDAGKADGYAAAKVYEYNAGKQAGIAEAGNYTFKSLISSAIDVPVYTIFGLLDFNLLGINLKSFFLSIFTIMLVIVVVRLVLGGM